MAMNRLVLITVLLSISLCMVVIEAAKDSSAPSRSKRQSFRSRCVSCSVNGKLYDGHSRFEYEEGCFKFRCICRCNGSWECPARHTINICENPQASKSSSSSSSSSSATSSSSVSHHQCQSCTVRGKEHPGHAYFTDVDGCITNDACICYCNGTWVCPAERARNTCLESSASSRRESSSGTTRAESREQEDRRTADRQRPQHSGCGNCTVDGQTFPGHSYFELEQGCRKMRYCICYCNGSWNCPDQYVENICDDADTASPSSSSSSSSSESSSSSSSSWSSSSSTSSSSSRRQSECLSCSVEDRTFPGNEYFQITVGCIEYRNCVCYCNGSWSCPPSRAREICDNNGDVFDVSTEESECRDCVVNGRRVQGRFETTNECFEYTNCICHCNGSWSCSGEGARNICEGQDGGDSDTSSCRRCEVYGQTFPGNQRFQVQQGCMEYNDCLCRCDGSWSCPDEGVRDKCKETDDTSSSRCRTCQVYGQTFPGNQYFRVQNDCIEYNNCICRCDGSWTCPSEGAKNTCEETDYSSNRCRSCQVFGQTFPGNQYFQVQNGCVEYNKCICRCDGSWNCPEEGARDACRESEDTSNSRCRSCQVYGQSFPGNEYFEVQNECIEYKNCFCQCDGSWTCPSESARRICNSGSSSSTDSTSESEVTEASGCRSCVAYGQTFKGGDYFDVVDGCTSYRNCICRCTGQWRCDDRYTTNVCERNNSREDGRDREASSATWETRQNYTSSTTDSNQCRYCEAKNKVVQGNTYFELTDGCVEYDNCFCQCNGSWECPPQFTRNICTDTRPQAGRPGDTGLCYNCMAKGKIVTGNSNFELIDGCTRYPLCRCHCNGSYDCDVGRAQDICFNNGSSNDACSMCQARDGTVHRPNSQFRFVQECIEYGCDCFCNGSWSCPPDRSRWICQDKCLQCEVKGRKIENGTQFLHRTGCLEYTCDCHCNGSWSCPGATVRNTCPRGVRDNCNKCVVSQTEQYEGESDFVYKKDCTHYQCRCNCDGSWNCPGKDARNVCRGEVLGGCRSCVVSDTEYYRGETDFTLRKKCLSFECRCNCDGSWSCPSEKARDICLGEVPGGCRACRVAENEVYRAGATFDLRQDCLNFKCQCNCNGTWSCPGETARDICKGEVPGGCRSCVISENEYYPGDTDFEMVKNCIHFKCRCNCDGSYHCPGRTARRVCQSRSTDEESTCRACRVSETEQFQGGSTFYLERGCSRYECSCSCNGSYECPPSMTRSICNNEPTPQERASQCRDCKIGGDVYPGNSEFKLTRGCYQFDCKCPCQGRWSCDHRNPTKICQDRQAAITSTSGSPRVREDYISSSYSQATSITSERGSVETDINTPGNSRAREEYDTRRRTSTVVRDRATTDVSDRTTTDVRDRTTTNVRDRATTDVRDNIDDRRVTTTTNNDCRPCVYEGRQVQQGQIVTFERDCLLYRNCRCLCDGRWQCPRAENRCEAQPPVSVPVRPGRERTYITTKETNFTTNRDGRQVDSSAWVYVDGVDTTYRTSGDDRTGGGYSVQVDAKYIPVTSHGYRQQFSQYQEPSSSSTFYTSGSSSETEALSSHSASSSSSLSSSSSSSSSHSETTDNREISQCQRCQVDSMTYSSGARFDMRRQCVLYKCVCLCSGSYRCRLTSDNACSPDQRQNTCSNCVYQGMVYPGNMGFEVREGCTEKLCKCNCDGSHECDTGKPISGCTAATAAGQGFTGYGNFYPISPGIYPVSTGHITNTGRSIWTHTCTTCGGGGVMINHLPIHPASGTGTGGFDDPVMNAGDPSIHMGQAGGDGECPGCNINGQMRAGNSRFNFVKSCVEFDCYCSCGGSWKCSGRMSLNCTPGFEPETVPHSAECRSCVVQETEYPANARFSLRQGCYEYRCSCNCDGGWSCPPQRPVNLCPQTPTGSERGNVLDPQILREDRFVADQGYNSDEIQIIAEVNEADNHQSPPKHKTDDPGTQASDPCRKCEVRGVIYPSKSKFFMREGCIQRLCECHCSGSFSCAEDSIVNICTPEESVAARSIQCRDCRYGSDIFTGETDFQVTNGCFQYNCRCHCNGTHDCPTEKARNICTYRGKDEDVVPDEKTSRQYNSRIQPFRLSREDGNDVNTADVPGCKDCHVDGERVQKLSTFIRQIGCYESLCYCGCDGKPSCPASASVNTCELPDNLPIEQRKGCKVNRHTYFSRVFPRVENCLQRTCVCHDNGTWSCKRTANDRKVC